MRAGSLDACHTALPDTVAAAGLRLLLLRAAGQLPTADFPKAQSALEELAEDVAHPGGADWEGVAADAAIAQAQSDVVTARTSMWSWDDVAASTQRWQEELEAGTRTALDAVDDAERDGFEVGEDTTTFDIDP